MESYLLYIGKSALAAGAFYLVYLALFQHQKQFVFNRIYLPVSLAISILIPLITFTTVKYIEPNQSLTINSFAYLPEATEIVQPEFVYHWYHYLTGIYLFGVVGFLFHLLLGHFRAINIIRFSRLKELFGAKINVSNKDIHPFSFFNKIVLSEKTLDNPNLEIIVNHELIHVKERHTFDILFAEILFLFQWFNPFAWLIKDAMRNNLEYLTDDQIAQNNNAEAYQLAMVGLAHKKGVAPFLTALNGSQLKNRIVMMKKKPENKYALLKQLVVLPLLAVLVMGLSKKEVKTEFVQTENIEVQATNNLIYEKAPNSQVISINGTVLNEKGTPLANVSIYYTDHKNLIEETCSDEKGKYKIDINTEKPLLFFNSTGYKTKSVEIEESVTLNIQLEKLKSEEEKFMEGLSIEKNTSAKDASEIDLKTVKPNVKLYSDSLSKEKVVKGKVTDQNGQPLKEVNILIVSSYRTVKTDSKGNFKIQLNTKNETLVFGKSGYKTLEIKTNGKNNLDVQLEKENRLYVVDGKEYQEMPEDIDSDNIKSIDVLKGESGTNYFGEKGKNGAVIITTKSASVVNDAKIQLNAKSGNLLLYIVDGEEVDDITDLDPDDIESISVLKDKSATDLYGEKGKNGVICIETKFKENLNDKLTIVDGKEYDGEINDISPNEITSVSVLKDKSATEIYGSKGKNGVIILETEAGDNKEPLYFLDGKRIGVDEANSYFSNRQLVKEIATLSEAEARLKYGNAAKKGAVEIYLKENPTTVDKIFSWNSAKEKPLVFVDGKQFHDINQIDPVYISSVNVIKDASAKEKYGDLGKNGVIEITLKKPEELTQNEIPVVLNGKATGQKLNKIDRDLIEKIKKLEPEEATKKYGDFGKFGVLEVTSRKLYTEKVEVKSTAELKDEIITTPLELRKFIAKKIKYPVKAQEANEQGTTMVYVEFDETGVLKGNTIKGSKTNTKLDEVVVTALRNRNPVNTGNASKNDANNKLLLNETKEIVGQLPTVKIPEFKGQTVAISVKYVLQ